MAAEISRVRGIPFTVQSSRSTGGGCINRAAIISGDGQNWFVKLNAPGLQPMFDAEMAGLQEMYGTNTLRVPAPVCAGRTDEFSYLVLEHLDLGGRGGREGQEALGRQLAQMHRITRPQYGWDRDNTIGSTPQPNRPDRDWTAFWRDRRLGHQLALAAANGHRGRLQQRGERLLDALPGLMPATPPPASMLHGDLWSGNYAFTTDGRPVIFDPALYYGDRETDMAMTELFGGFPSRFHDAYNEAWPLDPGYAARKTLYNLYHILNHLNLFGGGYLSQAERMMEVLLGETG